ncbi:MAG: hypothetical protein ACR2PK_01255 [Acidimicrobiales bacterium]
MASFVRWFDKHSSLMVILLLFWGLFWLLNGGDKFFNENPKPNLDGWSRSAVITPTGTDVIEFDVHPTLPDGIYGVSRNDKFENYFDRLGLPRWVALTSVYAVAVLEVIVGLAFLAILAWTIGPSRWREKTGGGWGLFHDRTIHRLCFKTGIFIFLLFSVGDTLFGDRIELWEHGTFMILTLVTYDLWYRTDTWSQEHGEVTQAGT